MDMKCSERRCYQLVSGRTSWDGNRSEYSLPHRCVSIKHFYDVCSHRIPWFSHREDGRATRGKEQREKRLDGVLEHLGPEETRHEREEKMCWGEREKNQSGGSNGEEWEEERRRSCYRVIVHSKDTHSVLTIETPVIGLILLPLLPSFSLFLRPSGNHSQNSELLFNSWCTHFCGEEREREQNFNHMQTVVEAPLLSSLITHEEQRSSRNPTRLSFTHSSIISLSDSDVDAC